MEYPFNPDQISTCNDMVSWNIPAVLDNCVFWRNLPTYLPTYRPTYYYANYSYRTYLEVFTYYLLTYLPTYANYWGQKSCSKFSCYMYYVPWYLPTYGSYSRIIIGGKLGTTCTAANVYDRQKYKKPSSPTHL